MCNKIKITYSSVRRELILKAYIFYEFLESRMCNLLSYEYYREGLHH